MKSMEDQLKIKKEQLESIEVPEELEERLYTILKSKHRENNFFIRHKTAASFIIILLIFSIYNFDALAYYGRKIIGYDQVIYGSLKDLNELGEGQQIGKSYTFKDGSEVILDGVFLDENKLVVLYRLKAEDIEKVSGFLDVYLKGLFSESMCNDGRGLNDEKSKQIICAANFNPPNMFDRNLTFSLTSNDGEEGKIKFKLDMSKIINGAVNQKVDKSVEIDGIKYNFTSLSATPMSTAIKGNIEAGSKSQLFTNGIDGITRNLIIELNQTYERDGKEITEKIEGSGREISSKNENINFNYEFDGLKKDLKQLTLKVLKTEDMKIIDKEIKIDNNTKNINVDSVKISDVKIESGNTVITFITEKDVIFTAGLMIGGNEAKLIKESSDSINGGNLIKKIVRYEGSGSDMKLMFKDISKQRLIKQEFILYKAAD